MNIENILIANIAAAIEALYGQQTTADKIQLQKTR